jgi:hypothetical protein
VRADCVVDRLAAESGGRGVRDQSGLVEAEDELASEHKRLERYVSKRRRDQKIMTDGSGVGLGHEMPGAADQHVGPVALLMHDSSELAIIRCPLGRWLASEALDAAECGVLNNHWHTPSASHTMTEPFRLRTFRAPMWDLRVVVAREDYDRDVVS